MQDNFDVSSDTELLTAYLDNELEPQERAALERRLVSDEALRLELRSLRRAWDLLDAWPEVTVSRDFTTTTMNMIAKVIADEPVENKSSWSFLSISDRFSSGMLHTAVAIPLFLALVAAGGIAGYFHHRAVELEHLNSVAAAAVLPTLRYFPDMEVANDLKGFPMLDLLAQTELSRSTIPAPPANVENLHSWLDRLDPRDKELLRVREDDFKRLSEQDRSKFVSTWKVCAKRDDCASLQKAATLFAALLQSMESGKRALWKELPHDEKVAKLKEAAYYQIAIWYAENLSDADRKEINAWRENELDPLLGGQDAIYRWLGKRTLDDIEIKNREQVLALLLKNLSPKAQKIIEGVSANDRGIVLIRWIMFADGLGNTTKPRTVGELTEVYLSVTDGQREFIDLKDSRYAEWWLSMRYNQRKVDEMKRKSSGSPNSKQGQK